MFPKPASHATRLHTKLIQVLEATRAEKDDVTQVLIYFLANQLASYPPFNRDTFFEAAMDTLEETFEEMSEELDQEFQKN